MKLICSISSGCSFDGNDIFMNRIFLQLNLLINFQRCFFKFSRSLLCLLFPLLLLFPRNLLVSMLFHGYSLICGFCWCESRGVIRTFFEQLMEHLTKKLTPKSFWLFLQKGSIIVVWQGHKSASVKVLMELERQV